MTQIRTGQSITEFQSLIGGTLSKPPPTEAVQSQPNPNQFSKGPPVASADKGVAPKGAEGYFKNPKTTP